MPQSLEPVDAGIGGTLEGAWAALVSDSGPMAAAWASAPTIVRHTGLTESFPAVDELLATPLLGPPYLSLMMGGKALEIERYCRQERVVMFNRPDLRLDLDRVEAEVRAGAAIKFKPHGALEPADRGDCPEIGRARGKRVKVWGFQSSQGEKMVPAHRDPARVLALQVTGRKRWQLDGPPPDGPWSALAPVAASVQAGRPSHA